MGQRSPGQQCLPGRSQAGSWHRCVFSSYEVKVLLEFEIRWLKSLNLCGLKGFTGTLRRLVVGIVCAVMFTQ